MTNWYKGQAVRCVNDGGCVNLSYGKTYLIDRIYNGQDGKLLGFKHNSYVEYKESRFVPCENFKKEKPMKKTIKQAEYSDDIIRVDGQCPDLDYKFIGIHPSDSSRVIYTYITPGDKRGCVASMKSSMFFDIFKLKPKERWVLIRDHYSIDGSTRGPFSSMEEAIRYSKEYLAEPSEWEAIKLCDN